MAFKRIQILFLLGSLVVALFFSLQLSRSLRAYFSLQRAAQAKIIQWETKPIKGQFALIAKYEFKAQEKIWHGSYVFNPYYLNEPAAVQALKVKAKKKWAAWYNPDNPCDSALEKGFPFGLMVRTAICYGVLIYFFYLYKRLIRV